MRLKNGYINQVIICVVSIVFIFFVIAFFSNRILQFLFYDKIWAHKVNNIEKLNKANKLFSGVELDVVFYSNGNYFDVNHPPDKSSNLLITQYFQSQISNFNYKYWIDFKNLCVENEFISACILDSIATVYNINKLNIIVESVNPQCLKSFRNKGFLTSYYLPTGLNSLNESNLKVELEKINNNIFSYENSFISTEYKDYQILKKYFPNEKKLIWFTVYGSMNKINARLLLYEILLDENVNVLLIPY